MRFDGSTVWITGGGSGIGLALGKRLAQLGAGVTLFDRTLRPAVLLEVGAAARSAVPCDGHVLDVTDPASIATAFAAAAHKGGSPDLVVNSAGIVSAVEFERISAAEFDRVLRVNLYGSFNVAKAALDYLGAGTRLALVASLAGVAGGYGYSAYATSKFGVVGLAEVLRVELRPRGIGVSVICPPEVQTPMVEQEKAVRPLATGRMKLFAGSLTVEEAVDGIVAGLAAEDFLIVPGARGKLTYYLAKLLPRSLAQKVADRMVDQALADERAGRDR
jgi:NAD(P)-dependent dehydrogenase (short-subunit alcohol dehydrogenase family)